MSAVEFTVVTVPISPGLARALSVAEADAQEAQDLAFAGTLLTGFELDAVERFERDFERDFQRRLDEAVFFGSPEAIPSP